jgi:hypothetical protein
MGLHMKKRSKPSSDTIADVLAACRRRCCICYGLHKDDKSKKGQVAHLDHDPSNNEPDNLAFLCLPHHDEYDSKTSQSKGLTIEEVKRYRTELLAYLAEKMPPSDKEIVSRLVKAFDRPAFRTSFQQESSLPRFREAISQTIETLNTGRTPQGLQISSKMQIRDTALRNSVDQLVQALVALRASYDSLLRSGDIRPCGCNVPDCPVHFLSPLAIEEMDARRLRLLSLVHALDSSVPQGFYETE